MSYFLGNYNKIPLEIVETIEENKNVEYVFNYDEKTNIEGVKK